MKKKIEKEKGKKSSLPLHRTAGSFKIRGVVNQMLAAAPGLRSSGSAPVTMSAGNYGKAFAHSLSSLEGIESGLVVMPTIAPQDRVDLIRSMGCRVEQVGWGEKMGRPKSAAPHSLYPRKRTPLIRVKTALARLQGFTTLIRYMLMA